MFKNKGKESPPTRGFPVQQETRTGKVTWHGFYLPVPLSLPQSRALWWALSMSSTWGELARLWRHPDHREFATYIYIPPASLPVFINWGFPDLKESLKVLLGLHSKVLKARHTVTRPDEKQDGKIVGERRQKRRRFMQNSFPLSLEFISDPTVVVSVAFFSLFGLIFSRENQVEHAQQRM